MKLLKKCGSCGVYSLEAACAGCGAVTESAHPPKYSFEDNYAAYRRKEKYGGLSGLG